MRTGDEKYMLASGVLRHLMQYPKDSKGIVYWLKDGNHIYADTISMPFSLPVRDNDRG